MRIFIWAGGGILALIVLILVLAYGPGSLAAQRFDPTPPDANLLALFDEEVAPLVREHGLFGAEDVEPGPDGRLYTGLPDGRILARSVEGGWSEIAHTGGRPLGLAFDGEGRLIVADALRGLLRREAGDWTVMMAPVPDGALVFTDDLTVLEDGSIILSDASLRYGYGEYMTSFLEGEQTGVIYRVTAPGEYEVLAEGLAFANGITHDPETGLIYINETWAGRVWTLDPETGELSIFVDGLPGYPDNLHWDAERDWLWIALPSKRSAELEPLHPRPFVKRLVWRWIQLAGLPPLPPRPVMVLAVDRNGAPVHALLGPDDQDFGVTSAAPWRGRLWTVGLERGTADAFALPEAPVQ
ncbi:MAG: SMP-30/gluconolactonase/LRE family protein [Pseudomonadota bacterium]